MQQREGMAQQGEEMGQELEEGVEELLDEKQAPGPFGEPWLHWLRRFARFLLNLDEKRPNDQYSTK